MSARQPRSAALRVMLPKPGQVATHLLPPLLRRLIQVIGESQAYRLCETWGGTPLVVPVRVQAAHAEHPVCLVIGPQAFARWVDEWGGDTMQIPKADSLLLQVRHRRVCELAHDARLQGRGLASVALATGYSLRQVFNILGAEAEDRAAADGQWDLFADTLVATGVVTEPAPAAAPLMPSAHNPFPRQGSV